MLDLSPWSWVFLAFSAFLFGMAKTGLPGLASVAIPLAAFVIPAKASTGLILPLLIVGDIFAVALYRRHAEWPHLIRLLPYTLAGIVIGAVALNHVSDRQLRPIIGGIILSLLALNAWQEKVRDPEAGIPSSRLFAGGLGMAAGITTMMANAAGPIMAIYLIAMRLPKAAFIGTAAWFFFMVNLIKVPFSAGQGLITFHSVGVNLVLVPMVVAGAFAGMRLANRIPEKTFKQIVRWLAALGGLCLFL